MPQVVTVSATTAAYAMEATKPPQRVPRGTLVEEQLQVFAERAAKGDDFRLRAILTVVQPPALSLHFLTAGQAKHEQATLKEALAAYLSSTS
ncbi:hypothetical protein [Ciceribacter thiooxidans]|uniref:Uncharacterized protein n=1 Tax=Ciceribacter thiooxidans TaxID=1969821 RepID=A0ABV7I0S8_9HYPH|nr:hypothetical protein [Ciceribacter thiooxidans]MDI6835570.1 hypothetical protein [Rhizobiaceae bacterium]